MSKKVERYKKQLSAQLKDLGEKVDYMDMEKLPDADRLSECELEALRIGAVSAIVAMRTMLGEFGSIRNDSSEYIAVAIGSAAINCHVHFNVDEEEPSVKITVEHKG